ncbi:SDR family NAD(P)-dependent oxidoreductase [Bifidobacterium cuniculi]|uniref:3-oxiacil-(Acyl-carrier-protein) reductase n=1 Tax=Bifidobacterium cuniculi TaxID=1688 RepID=A0A087ATI3_9BIFI|nr:SDR family oxidoreductase [Bifidobacterium cuniculi]KFI62083.1 3-oxiacil-(acyl-carrier-protein) reductase [Bifidobacterium cuniculi]
MNTGTTTAHPLEQRTAVMSGATRGVGRDVALALAEAGMNICLLTHNPVDAALTVKLIEIAGGNVVALPCMVDDDAALTDAMSQACVMFDTGVDLMFINMGLMPDAYDYPQAPVGHITGDQWSDYMESSSRGAFVSTARAARYMQNQPQGGVIINTAFHGGTARPGLALYAASRAALRAVCDTVNLESAAEGLPVRAHMLASGDTERDRDAIVDTVLKLAYAVGRDQAPTIIDLRRPRQEAVAAPSWMTILTTARWIRWPSQNRT